MEQGHIMINLWMKGDSTPIHQTVTYRSLSREDQRPLSPESDLTISLTVEDTDEDPVNPRGSRDYSFAVYVGLG